ncbi:MAG: hypothetical protein KBT21_00335 [Treponema sp.]|nr:hypothetical protein [Candidatus Treponema merdequi]
MPYTNIPAVNTSSSESGKTSPGTDSTSSLPNIQFRDRLFKAIFGRDTEQSKRWRLDLYNALNNSNLQKKCKSLYDYTSYISRVTDNKDRGLSAKEAVNEAVEWAAKENLLNGFFKVQNKEILGMILEEFDEGLLRRSLYRDGFAEGIEKGRETAQAENARNFFENGVSIELISKSLHIPEEKVRELINQPSNS